MDYSTFINMGENYLPNFPMDGAVAKERNDSAEIKLQQIKADISARVKSIHKESFSDKAATVMGSMAYDMILAPKLD